MAQTLISKDDTCAKTAGLGMVTTWEIIGSPDLYMGYLSTDGYTVKASFTWQSLSAYTTDANGATIDSTTTAGAAVIGTCVEMLDSDGLNYLNDYEKGGNIAICHWMYYMGQSDTSSTTNGGSSGRHWGETRYLSDLAWGEQGSQINGVSIQNLGHPLGVLENGFALDPVKELYSFADKYVYTMFWYQPKYQTNFATGTLRRYNGGKEGDKVRAYCVSARNLSSAAYFGITATDVTGAENGYIVLSGATTLAISALAYGVTSLAF